MDQDTTWHAVGQIVRNGWGPLKIAAPMLPFRFVLPQVTEIIEDRTWCRRSVGLIELCQNITVATLNHGGQEMSQMLNWVNCIKTAQWTEPFFGTCYHSPGIQCVRRALGLPKNNSTPRNLSKTPDFAIFSFFSSHCMHCQQQCNSQNYYYYYKNCFFLNFF